MKLEHVVRQDIKITQSQRLQLTPEIIQNLQILKFNVYELDSFVSEKLLENPMLDRGHGEESHSMSDLSDSNSDNIQRREIENSSEKKEIKDRSDELDWSEYLSNTEYDDISYRSMGKSSFGQSDNDKYYLEPSADLEQTLEEVLMLQLDFTDDIFFIKSIASYIIQSLDENGYLRCDLSDIANELNVSMTEAEEALTIVQSFEPFGVGARDLRECMLIQLRNIGEDDDLIEQIVENYLEEIAQNKINYISKKTRRDIKDVQNAADLIKKLEPKPGRSYKSAGSTRYVMPDVKIEYKDGTFTIDVNEDASPSLSISSVYRKILLSSEKDSEEAKYLTDRLNSALWLIRSIEQRKETIYNVVRAIVEFQKDFFEKGERYLKPMTLKQIADEVGVHESTISRTVNGKYMQSPSGIYELRFFFGSGIATEDGTGISSKGIKSVIAEIVENEDPHNPLSDSMITSILKEQGMDISRRTVAKYREELNIPSSVVRKRIL